MYSRISFLIVDSSFSFQLHVNRTEIPRYHENRSHKSGNLSTLDHYKLLTNRQIEKLYKMNKLDFEVFGYDASPFFNVGLNTGLKYRS